MTCIIGYVDDNNRVWMGGDSAGVSGYNYCLRRDSKVFKNANIIFGFTTSFRMGQLLQYKLVIPKHNLEAKTDFEYLCTDFMDAVMKCFKKNNWAELNNNKLEGGVFLIGYRGNLYIVYGNFQVAQLYDRFASVGCGEDYAKGAMRVLIQENKNNTMHPEEMIETALTVVESFSTAVKRPFNIISI